MKTSQQSRRMLRDTKHKRHRASDDEQQMPLTLEQKLDEALDETFPASDPPAITVLQRIGSSR